MNTIKLFAVACLGFILFSCSNNSKKAFDYSQDITRQEQQLIPAITEAENAIANLFEAGNTDSARLVSDNMAAQIQKTIDTIQHKSLPSGIKGGDSFKQAALKYFEGLKSIYTGYSSVAAQTDTAAYRIESEKLMETVAAKDQLTKDIVSAQQQFASDNGFQVEGHSKN